MTNEKKAKQLSRVWSVSGTDYTAYDCLMQMVEWKNQQAIEYLYKNIQSLLKDYGVSEESADIATQLFLANFKKAMEK